MQRVAIIGLGYVGITLAVYLCENGLNVYGIDINEELIAELNKGISVIKEAGVPDLVEKYTIKGNLKTSSDMSVITDVDVVIVCVGTPLVEGHTPQMEVIENASNCIAKYLRKGHVVIYKSTVVPGTTVRTILPILERVSGLRAGIEFMLAYCPERLSEGSRMTDFGGIALEEIRSVPMIVGGINPQSTEAVVRFWNSLGISTIKVSTPAVAEMAKLADNWWIDLNIALAHETGLLCEKLQIDAYEVIEAANTLPKNRYNVNILLPGSGVGGSCLTKDPWFIYTLAKKYNLNLRTCRISREINDGAPKHMYELIVEALKDIDKHVKDAKVSVLGLSFKQATADIRCTPSAPLIELLIENGAEVTAFDPWVSLEESKKVAGSCAVESLEEALKSSDCLVLVTAQPEFRSILFDEIKSLVAPRCAVVDGRRAFDPIKVISAGFTYWAVGMGKMELNQYE